MRYTSFILLCFLVSCAQQTPLTGGQKDVTPPQLDSSKTYPPSLATFFNGNEVEFSIQSLCVHRIQVIVGKNYFEA